MANHGWKMKSLQKRKPSKPYDRPKSFISKVKDIFNPWSWTRSSRSEEAKDEVEVDSESPTSSQQGERQPSAFRSPRTTIGGPSRVDYTPSVKDYNPLNDPRNLSFRSKATIGTLSTDVFKDDKIRNIFGEPLQPDDMVDVMSTKSTCGSDVSSQSIGEEEKADNESMSSSVEETFPPSDGNTGKLVLKEVLAPSTKVSPKGKSPLSGSSRLGLQSSPQSLNIHQSMIRGDPLLSKSLFSSSERFTDERRDHQVATPLPALDRSSRNASPVSLVNRGHKASPSFSLPAYITPVRQRSTMSRSSFNSPYYQSGKSSYFSSTTKSPFKRSRPESPSSPELPPIRQTVTATPAGSTSSTTQTAKRILQTLQTVTSPVQLSYVLPPKPPLQPVAKRRRGNLDARAPPVASLVTPSIASVTLRNSSTEQSLLAGSRDSAPEGPGHNQSTSLLSQSHMVRHASADQSISKGHEGQRSKGPSPKRGPHQVQHQENPFDLPPPISLPALKNMAPFSIGIVSKPTTSHVDHMTQSTAVTMSSPKVQFSPTVSSPVILNISPDFKIPNMVTKGTVSPSNSNDFIFATPTQKSSPKINVQNDNKQFMFSPPGTAVGMVRSSMPTAISSSPPSMPSLSSADFSVKVMSDGKSLISQESTKKETLKSDLKYGKPTEPSSVIDLDESDNDSGAASKPGKPSEPLERQPIKPKLVLTNFASGNMWSCDSCLLQNKEGDTECMACKAKRPGSEKAPLRQSQTAAEGGWTCDTCMVPNGKEAEQCVCCSASKPGSKNTAPKTSSVTSTLMKLPVTAAAEGGWTCDTCMVPNEKEAEQCVCCSASKPGSKNALEAPPPSSQSASSASGFKINVSLPKFNSNEKNLSGGLNVPEGGFKLPAFQTSTIPSESKPAEPEKNLQKTVTFALGEATKSQTTQSSEKITVPTGQGLKLGGSGGLKLGGSEGLKLGGSEGLKLGGSAGLKLGGSEGLKLGGSEGLKLGGSAGLKLGGSEGLKLGGSEGLKLGGSEGLKLGGSEGLKLGGSEGLKLGGSEGLKLGGSEGLKLGGSEGLKLGGSAGLNLDQGNLKLSGNASFKGGILKLGALSKQDSSTTSKSTLLSSSSGNQFEQNLSKQSTAPSGPLFGTVPQSANTSTPSINDTPSFLSAFKKEGGGSIFSSQSQQGGSSVSNGSSLTGGNLFNSQQTKSEKGPVGSSVSIIGNNLQLGLPSTSQSGSLQLGLPSTSQSGSLQLGLPSTSQSGSLQLGLPSTSQSGSLQLGLPSTSQSGSLQLGLPSTSQSGSLQLGHPSTSQSGSLQLGHPSTSQSGSLQLGLPSTSQSGSLQLGLPSTPQSGSLQLGLPSTSQSGSLQLGHPSTSQSGSLQLGLPSTSQSGSLQLGHSSTSQSGGVTLQLNQSSGGSGPSLFASGGLFKEPLAPLSLSGQQSAPPNQTPSINPFFSGGLSATASPSNANPFQAGVQGQGSFSTQNSLTFGINPMNRSSEMLQFGGQGGTAPSGAQNPFQVSKPPMFNASSPPVINFANTNNALNMFSPGGGLQSGIGTPSTAGRPIKQARRRAGRK